MRKSERLRLLELNSLKMQMEIEILQSAIQMMLDQNGIKNPDLDAGKWYNKKIPNN